jgi:hypothetical protein
MFRGRFGVTKSEHLNNIEITKKENNKKRVKIFSEREEKAAVKTKLTNITTT